MSRYKFAVMAVALLGFGMWCHGASATITFDEVDKTLELYYASGPDDWESNYGPISISDGVANTTYQVLVVRWYNVDYTYTEGFPNPPAKSYDTDGGGDWSGELSAVNDTNKDGRLILVLYNSDGTSQLDSEEVAVECIE